MPKKRLRNKQASAQAKRKRSEAYKKGLKGKSNYAKKRQYLTSNGGFGFQYPEPKPWKS